MHHSQWSETLLQQRPPGADMTSPPATRSQSVASDRPSVFKYPSLLSPPTASRPDPAYIAASAASQIITNDQDPQSFELAVDVDPSSSGEPALVMPAALALVNSFLDQLLYNILCAARSTSLASLKPAVSEVLRPTLAREVIAGAEEELHEYLGRGIDEDQSGYYDGQDPTVEWDLDAAWRQARLRCMIYSSLGDMEGEDEEIFAEEDQHSSLGDAYGHSISGPDLVSPAVAIFLTSILEFIGEQILILAGHAASQRAQARKRDANTHDDAFPLIELSERLVVDELDAEKVALNPIFGRLWRAWRKRLRSPSASFTRSMSRESTLPRRRQLSHASSSRRSSVETAEGPSTVLDHPQTTSLTEVPEEEVAATIAANIALPMSDNDVEEIEVPGLATSQSTTRAASPFERVEGKKRPRSLTTHRLLSRGLSISGISRSHVPDISELATSPAERARRTRSSSLPTPRPTPLNFSTEDIVDEPAFFTPLQSPDRLQASSSDAPDMQNQLTSNNSIDGHMSNSAELDQLRSTQSGKDEQVLQPSHPHTPIENLPRDNVSVLANAAGLDPGVKADGLRVRTPAGRPSLERLIIEPDEPTAEEMDGTTVEEVPYARNVPPGIAGSASDFTGNISDNPELSQIRSEIESDTRSVSPLESLETDVRPIQPVKDRQSIERESSADSSAIGVARTSNVPILPSNSTPFASTGSERYGPGYQNERAIGLVDLRNGVIHEEPAMEGTGDGSGDKRDTPQLHKSHDSPTLPHSAGAQEETTMVTTGTGTPDQRDVTREPVTRGSAVEPFRGPLRQATKGSGKTSDKALPSEPIPDGPSSALHSASSTPPYDRLSEIEAEPETVSSTLLSKNLSAGRITPDQRHRVSSATSGVPADRASVQRVFTPPSTPREATTARPWRSDSFGKGQRPVQLTGPGAPHVSHKLKNLMSRTQEEQEKHTSKGPISEDDDSTLVSGKYSRTVVKPKSKEKSFEQLMNSDETIQYTLTPPNMREMEDTLRRSDLAEPATLIKEGKLEDDLPRLTAQRSSAPKTLVDGRAKPSVQTSKPPSPSSNAPHSPAVSSKENKPIKKSVPISRPHPPSTTRPGAPVARDGRAEWPSTREIAEFIRTTGPDGDSEAAPEDLPSRSRSVPTKESQSRPFAAALRPSRNTPQKSSPVLQNSALVQTRDAPVRSATSRHKSRLQARDAVVSLSDDSFALADFIRQGPQDQDDGQGSSVPQTVSPMRTKHQAEPESSLVGGRLNDVTSPQSTTSTRNGSSKSQAHSIQSSYNSQTALLGNKAVGSEAVASGSGPPIQRKQRRVRDPYAIDTDSEDEVISKGPAKPRREEESLMDFLRNVPPPTPTSLPSAFDDVPKPGSKTLQKRESSGVTRSRLGRNDYNRRTSSKSLVKKTPPNQGEGPSTTSFNMDSKAPQLSFQSPSNDSLHFDPTDSYRASSRNIAGSSSLASTTPNTTISSRDNPDRRPHMRGAVGGSLSRSGRAESGSMGDLASFLKSTDPPAVPSPSAYIPPPEKEESGFSKLFRKKKSTGVA